DATHVRGIWRHTSLADYRRPAPNWKTILDIDALAQAEGRNWIFKGANCLPPQQRFCLVSLSDGGKDAVTVREFDAKAKTFVRNGFSLPEGKHRFEWVDADTLAVATDFGPDSSGNGAMTESGYPFVLKLLMRGETLAQAREVFRGAPKDGGYGVDPAVLRDDAGKVVDILAVRPVSTFDAEYYLVKNGAPRRIELPLKAQYQAFVDGRIVFTLQQAWGGFPQGAAISFDGARLSRGEPAPPDLVFAPAPNQAIERVSDTRGKLIVQMLEDVRGAVYAFDYAGGAWTQKRLGLPLTATLSIVSTSSQDDSVFVSAQSFVSPTSLWLVDDRGMVDHIKAQTDKFDSKDVAVQQEYAVSSDGVRIPFFIVRTFAAAKAPTGAILFGYGGFEVSKPPVYLPEMGKLWLENGGAYVIANIRGGGEFGPAWHQSVLRENRQKAFDDFAAVARELVKLGVATPDRIGIYGRSNGGVLTSVTLTQHPELIGGAVIESPLIDMLRYQDLPPGASWIGEYGDPRVPGDAAFIAKYSAYQNIRPGQAYPEPYITTNTRDDRVHPGHARKFAARLQAMGYAALYYENTEGGHSNDSDPVLNAERWARHYIYLTQKLMDRPSSHVGGP
ncbi:MAG: S9 family peptidase, partial [Alphaproteobacteria bacterium]|nr:S9 family peptidase [Alphaproteobacteria bacterium]